MQYIAKLCADYMRAHVSANHGVKLKSGHAHELVAAVFGYQSRAALLADADYPIANLSKASIFVLYPTAQIDERRARLDGLPVSLPDTYELAEAVYTGLISEMPLSGILSESYKNLASELADDYLRQNGMQRFLRPVTENVEIDHEADHTLLTVLRFCQNAVDDGLRLRDAKITTTIILLRVAGRVGYAKPSISAEVELFGNRR